MAENKPRRPLVAQRRDLEDFTDVEYTQTPARPTGQAQNQASEPVQPDDMASFSFKGRRGQLFKIALVNSLLTIFTLGFYRFWAKTRVRRYFWSNTRVQNEALEYTGTGMELFIGFLVVLAILVPIFALYEGALFLADSTSYWMTFALNVIYSFALLSFFQYAFYRMWRYRFSRTTWRGIRFQQAGSAWGYLGVSLKWLLISYLTLGIAVPWMRSAQWAYRLKHLNFGNLGFSYGGQGKSLLKYWSVVWLVWVVPVGGATLYYLPVLAEMTHLATTMHEDGSRLLELFEQLKIYYLIILPSGLLGSLFYIWYRVKEFNYLVSQVDFQNARFSSHIRTFPILGSLILCGILVLLAWLAVFTGSIALIIPSVAELAWSSPHATVLGQVLGVGIVVIFILVALPLITAVILDYNITRHVFSNITIENPEAFSSALATVAQAPEFGEGLADALDVGAF